MRYFLMLLCTFYALSAQAAPQAVKKIKLLDGVLVTGAGFIAGPATVGEKTFQATVTGTGAVTATVLVQVSDDPDTLGWVTLGTVTLSGTTTTTDAFASDTGWLYYRGNVTAVTGTGAAVYLYGSQE